MFLKIIVQMKLYKKLISVIPATNDRVSSGKKGRRYIMGRAALPPAVSILRLFSLAFLPTIQSTIFLPPNFPIMNINEEVSITEAEQIRNVLPIPQGV